MNAGLAFRRLEGDAADYLQLAPPGSRMFVEILDGQAACWRAL